MNSDWFWTAWLKEFRWIWYGVACLFIFSLAFFWYSYFQDADGIIHWARIQEQKLLESTIHSFSLGPFQLSVPAENYVIVEYFHGAPIELNQIAALAFLAILIACVNTLLAVITTLDRFWYFVGMALFILFVVSLRLEVLTLFAQPNQIPAIVILGIFSLLSYYFHALKSSIPFKARLLSFLALTLFTVTIIYFFSYVPYPGLHLAVTGYTSGLILSVLFILMVAHEIPAALVYIASQGNSKSLRHYSIISTIYISYVLITCLHEVDVINWNFIYVSPYILLSISAVLGLWGFKLREPLYKNVLSFAPYGVYLFTALGSICLITLSYLYGTYNDPVLRIVRYIIIFSHAGYGVIFLTYVFSNFILMLAQNLPVYKVLYRPNRMPYFTFRLAGLIMTLAFVFYSDWKQFVYNTIAGFYNNMGDLYELMDRSTLAEAYYIQASHYGYENNHANYALGTIHANTFDFENAHRDYRSANRKQATIYSLVNAGNVFIWENKYFDSIEALRKADERMPHSGEVKNNLGFTYGKIHNLDSSLLYLDRSLHYKNSRSSAETNFFALAALEILPINGDSILKAFGDANAATLSNALALATTQKTNFDTPVDVLSTAPLDLYRATLLNNYIIYHAKTLDSAIISKAYRIANDSLNRDYSESLKSALAFSYYHLGNVTKALSILGELAYITQSHQGKFNYIMGLWALEQHDPLLAASYFDFSVNANYKEAKLYKAIALSEAQDLSNARVAWDTVANKKDQNEQQVAERMKRILNVNMREAFALGDPEKYQFCRYKVGIKDSASFNSLVQTFNDDNYKAQALLDMTKKQFDWDNIKTAIQYFNKIGGLKLTNKNLYEDVRHMELLMLAKRKELKKIANQINNGIDFSASRRLEKIYYTALFNEASGDTLQAARNFEIIGTYNPYFEDGIIAAADYFRHHSNDKMKSYNILVDAIQLNANSLKLLKAYAGEAQRMGFNEFAASAIQRINALYKQQ